MKPFGSQWKSGLAGAGLLVVGIYAGSILTGRSTAQARGPNATPASSPAPVVPVAAGAWSNAFAAVANAVRPSVVYVQVESKQAGGNTVTMIPAPFREFFREWGAPAPNVDRAPPLIRRGSGSGFVISPDGYILTNNHVVDGADRVQVRTFDGRTFSAKVVGHDANTDIAVIKVNGHNLRPVSFGNSDSAEVGDWVLAIGNPMSEELTFTVTAGIISGKGRPLSGLPNATKYGIQDFIQTDAAINPGNSGGPLVNAAGQVVGVNSAIASNTGSYEGYGFAIPANLARRAADELIKHGHITRAVIGVTIRPVDQDDADYVGLDSIRGVVVQDYSGSDSPAREAGLQPGDVVTAIDNTPVQYVAQFQELVAFRHPGDVVRLTVQRKGGKHTTVDVKLASAPDSTSEHHASTASNLDSSAPSASKFGFTVTGMDALRGNRIGTEHRGVVVESVDPDGPAGAKLVPSDAEQAPDIITDVDGERVHTVAEFNSAVASARAGSVVSLHVYNASQDASRVVRLRVK